MTPGERLKQVREKSELSQSVFGSKLGWSHNKIRDLESGKQKITMEVAQTVEDFFFVDKYWLRTGEGEMIGVDHIAALKDIAGGDTCQHVDIYNMVEAGAGAVPEWHEPIDRRAIPSRYLLKGMRPVLVRGRSMEPTFKNGAIIGIDENDRQVIGGEAYAVMLPYEGAVIKRLYPLPDGVLIRSDNKEFPEVKLMKADVPDYFILGRVCWVVQEV